MSSTFSLAIPSPCHEKWNDLTPTHQGRFCDSCQKEVIDFSQWSEERIKAYFKNIPLQNGKARSICGRFQPAQLKTYDESKQGHHAWLPASVLGLLLLLASKPSEAQTIKRQVPTRIVEMKMGEAAAPSRTALPALCIIGVVKDATDGSPMPGVSIVRRGTSQGTVTGADGTYTFVIDDPMPSDTLLFSFIGYHPIEYSLNKGDEIKEVHLEMQLDVSVLGGLVDVNVLGELVNVPKWSPRRIWWKIRNIFR